MEDFLMKAATMIAVALATFSSFPSTAQQQPAQQPMQQQQQQDQQPQQSPSATSPSSTSPGAQSQQGDINANPNAAAAAQLKPVSGELESKLDSKSAKQGDSVVVKTKEDIKFAGGADIPKGSKLMGHVTNVQARGEGKENSQIAIQFDRAELKGGQTVAIESVIQSVSPSADAGGNNGVPGNYGSTPSSPSTPSSASPSMNGSNGSMNQGSANSRTGLASNTTAQPGATDQNTNSGMPAPGSIVARNGNVAIRTTAIPGVLLANDINGLPFTNASGLLLGARRDIHLDGGTQMVVAVVAAPQGAGGGMSR
jgi:hypothetical protein